MINGHKVLIAIPAWNEEQSIGKILSEANRLYSSSDLLVVDDGSHDRTAQIATEGGAKVVRHTQNLGYTAAIQTGRGYALDSGYDFLVFIDADGQHQPSDIDRILDPVLKGEADQVRGSRELGRYDRKEPFHLRIARWVCSALISLRLGKTFTDVTSGFKAENRKVTECFKKIYDTSSKIHLSNTNDIEEHLLAHKMRFKLMEVPVVMECRNNGTTKCYTPRQLLVFPLDLVRTFWRNL